MHALLISAFGDADTLRMKERPTPSPAAHEVLIHVAAAGVNRADILQRQGKYPPPEGASDILGLEVAGTVAALGPDTTRWKIGDKICALLAGGGYADYVAVDESNCLPIPANLSFSEAAALPEALATVWTNLFDSAAFQPQESVLVHGGSSGIGTTAIQMVKALGGKIYVTVANADKAEACRKLGADGVIQYPTEDFVTAIQRLTNGRGVDIVLDMIGGPYIPRNLACLAAFGRHVSLSTQQGKMAEIDLRLIMQKRLTLTGSTLRGRSVTEKARILRQIEERIWPFVAEGTIKPLISYTAPLNLGAEAHKKMESGAHIGKIVLEVAGQAL